jgi:hypothetical protein
MLSQGNRSGSRAGEGAPAFDRIIGEMAAILPHRERTINEKPRATEIRAGLSRTGKKGGLGGEGDSSRSTAPTLNGALSSRRYCLNFWRRVREVEYRDLQALRYFIGSTTSPR